MYIGDISQPGRDVASMTQNEAIAILFIVIIRVTTFECFKVQIDINLAPVSLSNK